MQQEMEGFIKLIYDNTISDSNSNNKYLYLVYGNNSDNKRIFTVMLMIMLII